MTFGYHAVYAHTHHEAIQAAATHGFQYVQFDLNVPEFYIDREPIRGLRVIRDIAADCGVKLAFHAPGDTVGLFTDFPKIRAGILDHMARLLERANRLGAHHLTVHPLGPPQFRRADTLEDSFQTDHRGYFRDILSQNLVELAQAAGNVAVHVENSDLGSIAIEALEQVLPSHDRVRLALDWPKAHNRDLVTDPLQVAFFAKHLSAIGELHLHDMDKSGRSHLSIGQGSLDFQLLFRDFYRPGQWLTIEVRPVEKAAKARDRVLELMSKTTGT